MRRFKFATRLIGSIVLAVPLRAACITVPLDKYLSHPDVAAIFRATVMAVRTVRFRLPENFGFADGQIATVRVGRVWKGPVPLETALHFRQGEGLGRLERFKEYLVIAHRLDRVGREQFGLPPEGEDTFGANEVMS